jgi:hypothetical protein
MEHRSLQSSSYTEMVYYRGVWMTREDRNKFRPRARYSWAGIVAGMLFFMGLLALFAHYAPRL